MTKRHPGELHPVVVFADNKPKVEVKPETPDQAAANTIPVLVVVDDDKQRSRKLPAAAAAPPILVAADKALWINIVRFLPSADLQNTIRNMPELGGMVELVEAEHRTRQVLTYMQKRGSMKGREVGGGTSTGTSTSTSTSTSTGSANNGNENIVTLDPVSRLDVDIDRAIRQIEHRKDFWQCWTATALTYRAGKHGGFGELDRFHGFCDRAGINPSDGVRWCNSGGGGGDGNNGPGRTSTTGSSSTARDSSVCNGSSTAWIKSRLYRAYFLSTDKKLVLVCKNDPRDNPDFFSIHPRSADTIRCCGDPMIMVLGRRDRVVELKQWFAAATGTTTTTTTTTAATTATPGRGDSSSCSCSTFSLMDW